MKRSKELKPVHKEVLKVVGGVPMLLVALFLTVLVGSYIYEMEIMPNVFFLNALRIVLYGLTAIGAWFTFFIGLSKKRSTFGLSFIQFSSWLLTIYYSASYAFISIAFSMELLAGSSFFDIYLQYVFEIVKITFLTIMVKQSAKWVRETKFAFKELKYKIPGAFGLILFFIAIIATSVSEYFIYINHYNNLTNVLNGIDILENNYLSLINVHFGIKGIVQPYLPTFNDLGYIHLIAEAALKLIVFVCLILLRVKHVKATRSINEKVDDVSPKEIKDEENQLNN